MINQIEVGDLVYVIRSTPCGCSGPSQSLGTIFRVASIDFIPTYCTDCFAPIPTSICASRYDGYWFDLIRLKKIPPLDELNSMMLEEERPTSVFFLNTDPNEIPSLAELAELVK